VRGCAFRSVEEPGAPTKAARVFSMNQLVLVILVQSVCFLASWALVYLFARRVRIGHWLLSLIILVGLNWASFRVLTGAGATPSPLFWLPVLVVILGVVAFTDSWNVFGQAAFSSTLLLSFYFMAYVVALTASVHLGLPSLVFSLVLLILQAFALLLLGTGSYEILDVLCRIRWRHIHRPDPTGDWFPRVSLHVPAYNEPPDMVIETLDSLSRLDYPNYEVIVVDDNTTDPALWKPVEEHCRKLGFKFFHLEDWPGFKSGALNFALRETDPAAEIVGVVDSDYVVEPEYLRSCLGFFRESDVAFVQTPQDYRDVEPQDRYATACYHAYLYFFKISMASRNEHNGIIFAGTMGLIRTSVLQELGGWDEWCITEDAELSLRILDRGLRGFYVDRSFGRGLMPLNFEGLKKQRFRWAFGGMQILRRHWGTLMPWAHLSDPSHRLTPAQKWDYLMGGLQWLNDPVTVGFTMLLLLGTGSLLVAHSLFIQPLAPAVLYVPLLFVFMGVTRFMWALRSRVRCTMGQAASAFAILLGLTWVVTLACSLGLFKKQGVFLRTSKKRTATDRWHPVRIVSHEITLGALCGASAVALSWGLPAAPHVWLMVGLLFWQFLIYVSAPLSSFWGYQSEMHSLHPQYAAASRTTGLRPQMITDRPVVLRLAGALCIALLLFGMAVRLAPDDERLFRTNPNRIPFLPADLMATHPETQVKATLYLEEQAALRGSVERALALWEPNGIVRDANYTPADSSDDRIWSGREGIRQRYVEEFAQHRYLSLAHTSASVVIEGNRAVVVNDLRAELRSGRGVQFVFLAKGDRWIFHRSPEGWRIAELTVNRAPR
jgi:cellulose synthase/poly-beta-1,6-N-acetylglucosamine synthase-like glycosyltransferase